MKSHLIRCNFCGNDYASVEDFEKHIENCTQKKEYTLGYQIIYPDGRCESKEIPITSDDSYHDEDSDDKLPEPRATTFKMSRG